jgi:hypothetical protein
LKAVQKQSEQGVFGFPHLPFQAQVAKSIAQYAAEVRGSYDTVCVIGIGGSALGAWALDCGPRTAPGARRVHGRASAVGDSG